MGLNMNGIGDAGAAALANGLRAGDSALDTLKLDGNRIADAGAAALASLLASSKGLQTVWLRRNRFGPVARAALTASNPRVALSVDEAPAPVPPSAEVPPSSEVPLLSPAELSRLEAAGQLAFIKYDVADCTVTSTSI